MLSNRRLFLKTSALTAAALMAPAASGLRGQTKNKPSDTVRVAVVGIRSRGKSHYRNFSRLANVEVKTLCDIDERLFPDAVKEVEALTGKRPKTVVDFRTVLDDKEIDAVAIATPDHWHALHTLWACQAGKDVYVEKPLAYTLQEGRLMVRAGRRFNRIVQVGTQHVSDPVVAEAIDLIRDGLLGKIYLGRVIVFGHRSNIGRVKDSPVPPGVHWDLFLGPAPYRPFNENRFHYKWHWYWDTSTSELGNNAVHFLDVLRRGMNKRTHPVQVFCSGGFYGYDSDQEIPNLQSAHYAYADGVKLEVEVRSLYTNSEAGLKSGCFFYGDQGWMQVQPGAFQSFLGEKDEPGPTKTAADLQTASPELRGLNHFRNFIDCVRSRNAQDLRAEVGEGHLSTALSHLGNIAYRTRRLLEFNPHAERFINDEDADSYLQRDYRPPYLLPENI